MNDLEKQIKPFLKLSKINTLDSQQCPKGFTPQLQLVRGFVITRLNIWGFLRLFWFLSAVRLQERLMFYAKLSLVLYLYVPLGLYLSLKMVIKKYLQLSCVNTVASWQCHKGFDPQCGLVKMVCGHWTKKMFFFSSSYSSFSLQ